MFRQLHIEGFRGFRELHVAPLGRVNLIVGKNNSGKTALLDAVEMLVSDQPTPFLEGLIRRREVSQRLAEEPGGSPTKRYGLALLASLFPGHQITPDARFVLRGSDPTELHLEVGIGQAEPSMTNIFLAWNERSKPAKPGPASGIWVRRGGAEEKVTLPLTPQGALGYPSSPRSVRGEPPMYFLGTDRPDAQDLSSLWDKIMLTEEEPLVVEALRLLDPRVERLAFRGEGPDRNIVVKRQGEKHPVLLGSLGDGMRHLLSLALNLVLARKGYLLIDEIDTGLHHSVLSQMWRLLIETARRLDIQVFATTHSLDCIRALGDVQEQIAVTEDDLMLHRLEAGLPSSVPYKPQELVDAIAFQTEVR